MLRSSSVVERSAVNRLVAGSNPACGANASPDEGSRISSDAAGGWPEASDRVQARDSI